MPVYAGPNVINAIAAGIAQTIEVWAGGVLRFGGGTNPPPVDAFTPADIFAPTDPGVWYQYYLTPEQQVWRRNLLEQTENFGAASWQKFDASIEDNVTTSPVSTMTADKFIPNDGLNGFIQYGNTPPYNRQAGTVTINVKSAGHQFFVIATNDFGSAPAVIDLQTGEVVYSSTHPFFGNVVTTVTPEANGFHKVEVDWPVESRIYWSSSDSWVPNGYGVTLGVGNGVDGVYLWGAQFDAGAATTYQPITTPEQSFRNAFPEAHLWTDATCKVPVTALNQTIWCCVDQSQPYTQVPGAWAQTAGDAVVTIVGDTITVTGGTTNTSLSHPDSIIGSHTWCEIETITGDFTVVTAWIGGQPEFLLNGKNVTGGRNPGTGVNSISLPTGQDYSFKISPLMNSNANTWEAASAAARPLYGLINGGPAVGAIWDGIDDNGLSPSINFQGSNLCSVFYGLYLFADNTRGGIYDVSGSQPGSMFEFGNAQPVRFTATRGLAAQSSLNAPVNTAGSKVITNQSNLDTSSKSLIYRVNGSEIASSDVNAGAGGFTNGTINIGLERGNQWFQNMGMTDFVAIMKTTTPLETTNTEDFINDNLGAF